MNVIWRQSPNYSGNLGPKSVIVIHWWGNPADKPSLLGTVNWLCSPRAQVSAHDVVSGETVYRLVKEEHVAWHARDANAFSIGIEVDPNTPPGTYETLIELCREIADRHGMNRSRCIKRHKDYVNTQCPGTLDIERIRQGVLNQPAQGGADDMTIIVRPISKLKIQLKNPIPLWDIVEGKTLWDSGRSMEVTQMTNLVHGKVFWIPEDRAAKGELLGFWDMDVTRNAANIHDTQFDPAPGLDPVVVEKARLYDDIKKQFTL